MSEETPEERVARLERELADAKIEKLEHELADAKAAAHLPAAQVMRPGQAGVDRRAHAEADGARDAAKQALADLIADKREERQRAYDREHRYDRDDSRITPIDKKLAPAPRRIPTTFLVTEMIPFGWWIAFTLLMVAVSPIALWMFVPKLIPIAGVLTLVAIGVVRARMAKKRFALLRYGQVADIEHKEEASRGTYYSGTTYNNMKIPFARGWKVTREFYSGPKVVTRVRYHLDGKGGELKVGGRGYIDGVILVDSRDVSQALCVTSFPYDLDRDADGNWTGKLRPGLVATLAIGIVFYGAWIAMTVMAAMRFY